MLSRPLSTIELTVLGIISKQGPCKAYAVMRELATSSSSYYRSGAGTIYPSVARLLKAGYLTVSDPETKTYVLSTKGRAALEEWLSSPVSDHDLHHTVDLVRLRTYFLQAVEPARRRALLTDALARMKSHLATMRPKVAAYQKSGDPFSALAMEGTILETEARIAWMERLLARLDEMSA